MWESDWFVRTFLSEKGRAYSLVGPATRRSRLEKKAKRDETVSYDSYLVSSRDFVSRDGLEKYFVSRPI